MPRPAPQPEQLGLGVTISPAPPVLTPSRQSLLANCHALHAVLLCCAGTLFLNEGKADLQDAQLFLAVGFFSVLYQ